MGGKIVRTIGIARARFKIGMMNLGYNIRRLVQLERADGGCARLNALRVESVWHRACKDRAVAGQASKRSPIGGSPGHARCAVMLPTLEELTKDFYPGGATGEVELGGMGLKTLTAAVKLKGWDDQAMNQFGIGSKYGVVRIRTATRQWN